MKTHSSVNASLPAHHTECDGYIEQILRALLTAIISVAASIAVATADETPKDTALPFFPDPGSKTSNLQRSTKLADMVEPTPEELRKEGPRDWVVTHHDSVTVVCPLQHRAETLDRMDAEKTTLMAESGGSAAERTARAQRLEELEFLNVTLFADQSKEYRIRVSQLKRIVSFGEITDDEPVTPHPFDGEWKFHSLMLNGTEKEATDLVREEYADYSEQVYREFKIEDRKLWLGGEVQYELKPTATGWDITTSRQGEDDGGKGSVEVFGDILRLNVLVKETTDDECSAVEFWRIDPERDRTVQAMKKPC